MIADAQLMFSDAQVLSATAASTNSVDLGIARQIGTGEALGIVLSVDTAADITTGDETYVIAVQTDDNSAFSSPTTVSSTTVTAANLAAGKQVIIPFSAGQAYEQYVRLNYTLGGTTPSVTVTAFLQPLNMIQSQAYYADAYKIS